MRLFQAADVTEITSLTRSQLREWTARDRRNLISADVEASGPGRHALFTWQTTLVLGVLSGLQRDYAVEVGAWAPAMRTFRTKLEGISFPTLWGCFVAFKSPIDAELISPKGALTSTEGLYVDLHPHLLLLATKLSMTPPEQLPLFPAMAVTR